MVYVVEGVAQPDYPEWKGDEYKRTPTAFYHEGPLDLGATDLHLYVCAACPWAHRVLMTRNLSPTLRDKITVSVVSPYRDDNFGWEFRSDANHDQVKRFDDPAILPVTKDHSPLKAKLLLDVYLHACPTYTGTITTPTLYDAKSNKVVSNDSFSIMRVFSQTVPSEIGHLYPAELREEMDKEGRQTDEDLCKRVYMCGMARSQESYERSIVKLDAEIDRVEAKLSDGREWLIGDGMTVLDIQLIANLFRFDPVYHDLFKCYRRRIASFPYLSKYARRVANALPRSQLDLNQIVEHYWYNFDVANPNRVIPIAYREDFLEGGIEKFREPESVPTPEAGGSSADNLPDSSQQDQTNAEERRARGEFVRGVSAHRNWLGDDDFPVEPNRYVLFVSNNCPWCHRTMMARAMYPGMEELVEASVLFYRRGGEEPARWQFLPSDQAELKKFEIDRPSILDGISKEDPTGNGFKYVTDIYQFRDPDSKEKSVPILFDKKSGRVVSNESADIVRMFAMAAGVFDESKLARINELNARIYHDVNNGAYRAGFSSNQATHNEACAKYFQAFDWLDKMLAKSKYLLGDDAPSEADLRLFPTIYRHDPVYHSRMKLNVAMVRDYPNLNRWLLDMKANPAVQRGSRIEHCIAGYFGRTGNCNVPWSGLGHDGVADY